MKKFCDESLKFIEIRECLRPDIFLTSTQEFRQALEVSLQKYITNGFDIFIDYRMKSYFCFFSKGLESVLYQLPQISVCSSLKRSQNINSDAPLLVRK